jgi:hypothetical protein
MFYNVSRLMYTKGSVYYSDNNDSSYLIYNSAT